MPGQPVQPQHGPHTLWVARCEVDRRVPRLIECRGNVDALTRCGFDPPAVLPQFADPESLGQAIEEFEPVAALVQTQRLMNTLLLISLSPPPSDESRPASYLFLCFKTLFSLY